MNNGIQRFAPILVFICLFCAAYFVYLPGVAGGFLFDDYPNLEDLGTYRGVVDIETARNFIFGGIAGPLGRPISLATFLLDDNTWPSYAPLFKVTNVKIHLLVALCLCWATLLLMRLLRRDETESIWIAVIASGIWLLHPYMVSTTLYVIQRMAQLAALFMLVGTIAYLHGRLLLDKNKLAGYVWMSAGLSVGTLLAVFSKENGILLPLTIFTIEFCLPSSIPRLNLWWRLAFFGAPACAIAYFMLTKIEMSPDAWPARIFNQKERLLTEPRIIWEYLYHLYVPKIEVRGLFQDVFWVSRSLTSPATTMPAIIGVIALILSAVWLRKRYLYWSLAILYFFTSHLLESTHLNLELYFEHRNYAASVFLFLPIAVFLVDLRHKVSLHLLSICVLSLFMLLGFLTWKRANLWSNTDQLQLYWAASLPESPRARNRVGEMLYERGLGDQAIAYLEKADNEFQTSGLISVNAIGAKVFLNKAVEADFVSAGTRIAQQRYDLQALIGIRRLVDHVCNGSNNANYPAYTLGMLKAISGNPNYQKDSTFNRMSLYLEGKLYLKLHQPAPALERFQRAIPLYNTVGDAFVMSVNTSNAGYPVEALILLDMADELFLNNPDAIGAKSKAIYERQLKAARYAMQKQKQTLKQ